MVDVILPGKRVIALLIHKAVPRKQSVDFSYLY